MAGQSSLDCCSWEPGSKDVGLPASVSPSSTVSGPAACRMLLPESRMDFLFKSMLPRGAASVFQVLLSTASLTVKLSHGTRGNDGPLA